MKRRARVVIVIDTLYEPGEPLYSEQEYTFKLVARNLGLGMCYWQSGKWYPSVARARTAGRKVLAALREAEFVG